MMVYSLVFGAVNFLIFVAVIFFTLKAVRNLEQDSDVASAMIFLKEDTSRVFRNTALLVGTVWAGEVLVFASHLYGHWLRGAGYSMITLASAGVLYFSWKMSEVTEAPSRS